MKLHRWLVLSLFLVCCDARSENVPSRGHAPLSMREYRDPGGIFTLRFPEGWKAERKREDIGWVTLVSSASPLVKLAILANPIPDMHASQDLKDRQLNMLAEPYFRGWLASFEGQARTEIVRKAHRIKKQGMDALRLDIRYFRGDSHDPRTARAILLMSRRNVFFVTLSGDSAGIEVGDPVLESWQIASGE